eukprot:15364791-Ditylum_brightwellii.AAC.3
MRQRQMLKQNMYSCSLKIQLETLKTSRQTKAIKTSKEVCSTRFLCTGQQTTEHFTFPCTNFTLFTSRPRTAT